jgi:hypothetical protein
MSACPDLPSGVPSALVERDSAMLISMGIGVMARVTGRKISNVFGSNGTVTLPGGADNPKRYRKYFDG